MHMFPTETTVRAKWVKFVQKHRVDFGEAVIRCALFDLVYFEKHCFENDMAGKPGYAKRRDLIHNAIPLLLLYRQQTLSFLSEGPEVL